MHDKIKKFEPVVDKKFLIALSGFVWSIVGILLCNLAFGWLFMATNQMAFPLGLAGTLLALFIHHFGFLKLADRNIDRIMSKEKKICLFAFQPWKSYLLILIMIVMGITLRHSPLPKPYLAIIYIGFGGAMIFSSIRYFRVFVKHFSIR